MAASLPQTLLRSSWWAIALGLALELIQLGIVATTGQSSAWDGILVESAQKVTWSYIVCVALACGTASTRANPQVVGLLGLLAAPIAFGAARAMHKSVAQALSMASSGGAGPSPWLLAGIKAAEYACFGYLVARLIRRDERKLMPYARLGLMVGALFGALLLYVMHTQTPGGLNLANLLGRGITELLFPVGCACVLWTTVLLTPQESRSA